MQLKEICLNNFRIYKGFNPINLLPENDKNIIVISGKNGFGKTTFLMSLVWCLYGRQMGTVDELYRKEIAEKGSYAKYIAGSMNSLAAFQGDNKFSVSLTFSGVKMLGDNCSEVKITRTYDTRSSKDNVEVLIDGQHNEIIRNLTTDKQDGEEIFIRDYILPIEIAKFFFFDAEKIVSLAEMNSPEQRKNLSKAYTEVLGIKKYEDLKETLESLQDDYRKISATPEDRKTLNQIETDIRNKSIDVDNLEEKIKILGENKDEKFNESEEILKKLVLEGDSITMEELNKLKDEENACKEKLESLKNELKDVFDFIPFGLAGGVLNDISVQLEKESNYTLAKNQQENVEQKTKQIINDIDAARVNCMFYVDKDVQKFYDTQIENLIKKYFFSQIPQVEDDFAPLHDFSQQQQNELNALINNLKLSFKENFSRISDEHSRTKNELEKISRKIRNAEKDAEDEQIRELRNKKEELDKEVANLAIEIGGCQEKIRTAKEEIKKLKQQQAELRKKLDDSAQYTEKERQTKQLISELKNFISDFKEATKKTLEENILKELKSLMHKKGFISRVGVTINQAGDDIDINLYDKYDNKIDKSKLSMGERQMYASALLKSLVCESDIDFPVFIDSPMQKFDTEHAHNVIKEFYPSVSNQVVLFPLLIKELTEEEYELILKPNVSKTFLIKNYNSEWSQFEEVEPDELIRKYKSDNYAD
ncbi:MAG: DNA sulfur modification protein DndD [Bacteroidales bacterium]|nr:DNA sulfur modification protein DndD [Bacteroidales bacterium]